MKAIELQNPARRPEGSSTEREESHLLAQLDVRRFPRHVAIIMDGNGRWAQRRHLPRIAGHRAGVASARMMIETCARMGIQALTLYAFSLENWRRPKAEIDFLMRLLREYLRKELPEIHRNNIRMVVIGRPDGLPPAVRADIQHAMEKTAGNSGMQLAVALNYGGRAELVDAFNSILHARVTHADGNGWKNGGSSNGANGSADTAPAGNGRGFEPVDEETISRHLYTAGLPDPDLLIRTSGEMRVSNFLLWQIAYAEIYVTDTLWPDFGRARLYEALLDFQQRERRYGGLGERSAGQGDS